MLNAVNANTRGIHLYPASDVNSPRACQKHVWNTIPVGDVYPPAGEFLGYVAKAYGSYRPGGNPVLEGPLRATLTEAEADAADPTRVFWRVTGYFCG